uniref:Uncharacterized protein n=1 Tax=Anopheles farauti TaxID=69004 RepID=A0A182Q5C1_9DIPT
MLFAGGLYRLAYSVSRMFSYFCEWRSNSSPSGANSLSIPPVPDPPPRCPTPPPPLNAIRSYGLTSQRRMDLRLGVPLDAGVISSSSSASRSGSPTQTSWNESSFRPPTRDPPLLSDGDGDLAAALRFPPVDVLPLRPRDGLVLFARPRSFSFRLLLTDDLAPPAPPLSTGCVNRERLIKSYGSGLPLPRIEGRDFLPYSGQQQISTATSGGGGGGAGQYIACSGGGIPRTVPYTHVSAYFIVASWVAPDVAVADESDVGPLFTGASEGFCVGIFWRRCLAVGALKQRKCETITDTQTGNFSSGSKIIMTALAARGPLQDRDGKILLSVRSTTCIILSMSAGRRGRNGQN